MPGEDTCTCPIPERSHALPHWQNRQQLPLPLFTLFSGTGVLQPSPRPTRGRTPFPWQTPGTWPRGVGWRCRHRRGCFQMNPSLPGQTNRLLWRVFNFLCHGAAVCLLYREPLKTLGSNSNVFYRRGEIIECFQRALHGRESSIFAARRILHSLSFVLRHHSPPFLYFLEAESLTAFSCGFSLMEHLGVRSKNGLKVSRSPHHQTNEQLSGRGDRSASRDRGDRAPAPHAAPAAANLCPAGFSPDTSPVRTQQSRVVFLGQ